MKSKYIFFAVLAISVFTVCPSSGQKVVNTNTTAPVSEGGHRALEELAKLDQRNIQILAEVEWTTRTNVSFITSGDGSKREKTVELLVAQQQLVVHSLINIVESTNSWEAKDAASRVLGEYRALEAIHCLVNNIQQDTIFKMYAGMVSEDYRKPFGAALANIGDPAVPALLDRIGTEESDRVADRCVEVIVRIVGKQRSAELLRSRAEATTDEKTKEKLLRARSKT